MHRAYLKLTRLCTTSFGTPLSFMVDAWETKLLVLEDGQSVTRR